MTMHGVKPIWQRDECVLNGWLQVPSTFATEIMARAGWHSLTIDLQHGLVDYGAAVGMLQAIATTGTVPLARVPWNEPGIIMKLLDAGCLGIICPMINTGADCAAFVGACRYPPAGYRSYGPLRALLTVGPDYAAHANTTVTTIAMIETQSAVENLDDILSTPGLDAIYIGPADLSQSYGFAPRLDPEEPAILAVVDRIIAAARRHGVVVGMHTGSVAYARRMAAKGMRFVTVGSDGRMLANAAADITSAFRETPNEGPATGQY